MDLGKKSFVELAESCIHLLKIRLWKELGRLVQKYRIAINFFFKNFPNMLSNTFSNFISDMELTDHRNYDR